MAERPQLLRAGRRMARELLDSQRAPYAIRNGALAGFLDGAGFTSAHLVPPVGRHVVLEHTSGQRTRLLNFRTCNYLGLAGDPRLAEAGKRAIDEYGFGACSSPFGTGRTKLNHELEDKLASFLGVEAALVASSGFVANVAVMLGVPNATDAIVLDQFIHNSFVDGARGSRAKHVFFKHNDAADLDGALTELAPQGGDRFVGIEGIYSMEADVPDLVAIERVCAKHGAHIILDECHSLGTMGAHGRGLSEHLGRRLPPGVLLTGTLAKAIPVTGGYVAGPRAVIDALRLRGNAYAFSASTLTPPDAAAAIAALDILAAEPARPRKVQALAERLEHKLLAHGVSRAGGIVHVPVPETVADTIGGALAERGFGVPVYGYPAVPVGKDRLRVLLSAAHEEADVDALAVAIRELTPPSVRSE